MCLCVCLCASRAFFLKKGMWTARSRLSIILLLVVSFPGYCLMMLSSPSLTAVVCLAHESLQSASIRMVTLDVLESPEKVKTWHRLRSWYSTENSTQSD